MCQGLCSTLLELILKPFFFFSFLAQEGTC